VPKHGRSIVKRNKVKRRLREIGRRRVLPALDAAGIPMDILLRARWKAYEADFAELAEEVREALEELWSEAS
jgi:ribonuclease P protein component